MEEKERNSRSGLRSYDMGHDRLARTLSELNMMANVKVHWKGPRHLHYDSHEARLRTFINWPRYMRPTPTTLASAGFYVDMIYSKYNIYSLRIYNILLLHIHASECFYHFTTCAGDRTIYFNCGRFYRPDRRRTIPRSSMGPGPNSVFTPVHQRTPILRGMQQETGLFLYTLIVLMYIT